MMLKLLAAGNTGFTDKDIETIRSDGYEVEILGQEKEKPVSTDYDVVICNFLFVISHNSFVSRRNDERMKEQIMKNLIEWISKFLGCISNSYIYTLQALSFAA